MSFKIQHELPNVKFHARHHSFNITYMITSYHNIQHKLQPTNLVTYPKKITCTPTFKTNLKLKIILTRIIN